MSASQLNLDVTSTTGSQVSSCMYVQSDLPYIRPTHWFTSGLKSDNHYQENKVVWGLQRFQVNDFLPNLGFGLRIFLALFG